MNRETFHRIYSEIISLWPETLDVRDRHSFDNGGMRVDNLVAAHDEIDNFLENQKEYSDWYRLVDWTIYQLRHTKIKESDLGTINPRDLIAEDDVLSKCLENEDYSAEFRK